jgi:hypothetical protein
MAARLDGLTITPYAPHARSSRALTTAVGCFVAALAAEVGTIETVASVIASATDRVNARCDAPLFGTARQDNLIAIRQVKQKCFKKAWFFRIIFDLTSCALRKFSTGVLGGFGLS